VWGLQEHGERETAKKMSGGRANARRTRERDGKAKQRNSIYLAIDAAILVNLCLQGGRAVGESMRDDKKGSRANNADEETLENVFSPSLAEKKQKDKGTQLGGNLDPSRVVKESAKRGTNGSSAFINTQSTPVPRGARREAGSNKETCRKKIESSRGKVYLVGYGSNMGRENKSGPSGITCSRKAPSQPAASGKEHKRTAKETIYSKKGRWLKKRGPTKKKQTPQGEDGEINMKENPGPLS